MGRFVRARARGETASIFLPSSPSLLGFAGELELERDHVLGRKVNDEGDIFAAEDALVAQAQAGEAASAEEAKVAIRNVRRDANKHADGSEKDGDMSEDECKSVKDDVQELTKKFESTANDLATAKEAEVMGG